MASNYRYIFCDLLTNTVLGELPLTGVSFSQQLNQAGALSGHLLLSGLNATTFNVDASTTPTKVAVYVDYNGVLIWGGVIWGRSYANSTQTLTINAREFESYFERRRIGTSTAFTNTDQLTIAQNLVTLAQSAPFGNIGVQVGIATSGVLVSRQYYAYEKKTYYNALQDLSRAENGFDFNISVAYNGAGQPTKTLTFGYPRTGTVYSATSATALVFQMPASIVDYDYPEDGSISANTIIGLGAGSNEGKLISIQTDATKTAAGFPLLEEAANYSDVTDAAYLAQLALGQVNAVSSSPVTMSIVLSLTVSPVFTDYKLGDDARIMIKDARFPTGLDKVLRIVGIAVQVGDNSPERVTLTLTSTTN